MGVIDSSFGHSGCLVYRVALPPGANGEEEELMLNAEEVKSFLVAAMPVLPQATCASNSSGIA